MLALRLPDSSKNIISCYFVAVPSTGVLDYAPDFVQKPVTLFYCRVELWCYPGRFPLPFHSFANQGCMHISYTEKRTIPVINGIVRFIKRIQYTPRSLLKFPQKGLFIKPFPVSVSDRGIIVATCILLR